jgi:hypothetical protein
MTKGGVGGYVGPKGPTPKAGGAGGMTKGGVGGYVGPPDPSLRSG